MSNPTTPFGWQMPTATDLVTDLPADFEVFGQAVATSMADLLGGTSGQVLAKNSNTDMDFVWVTSDDANAIQNTIVDAKGDLIAASASDVPARLAVGANGETLVADSSTSTGLRYQGNFAAGKNKIINGDMNIWQRGTSFSTPADASYLADRYFVGKNGNATYTVSRQAATYGAIAGYEPNYYCRFAVSSIGTTTAMELHQRIEDVSTLAGETVTVSFWAKADATRALTVTILQSFGSGGSSLVVVANAASVGNATTSFQRFSYTFSMPQITGKTVGTGSFVDIGINMPASAFTIDFWGLQVEASNTATSFNTATGTIQGELAACQRYYEKSYAQGTAPGTANTWGNASISGLSSLAASTAGNVYGGNTLQFKVTKRTTPTMVLYEYGGTANAVRIYPSDTIRGGVTATPGVTDTGGGYISVDNSSANAITTNYSVNFSWTASAEL
jgi:hypothetical protein